MDIQINIEWTSLYRNLGASGKCFDFILNSNSGKKIMKLGSVTSHLCLPCKLRRVNNAFYLYCVNTGLIPVFGRIGAIVAQLEVFFSSVYL